jgi:hypothetical protein
MGSTGGGVCEVQHRGVDYITVRFIKPTKYLNINLSGYIDKRMESIVKITAKMLY